jgi:hypothetical protein
VFGKYAATAMELEAERRRETIAADMRAATMGRHEATPQGLPRARSGRTRSAVGRVVVVMAAIMRGRTAMANR